MLEPRIFPDWGDEQWLRDDSDRGWQFSLLQRFVGALDLFCKKLWPKLISSRGSSISALDGARNGDCSKAFGNFSSDETRSAIMVSSEEAAVISLVTSSWFGFSVILDHIRSTEMSCAHIGGETSDESQSYIFNSWDVSLRNYVQSSFQLPVARWMTACSKVPILL